MSAESALEPDQRRSDPAPREKTASTRELAMGAAWLLGIACMLRAIELLLGQNPLAVALLGALVVDFATSRAGVSWQVPEGDGAAAAIGRRLGLGAAAATAAVLVALAVGAVSGQVAIEAGTPSAAMGLALLRAVAIGARDELLLRGLVLSAARRAGAREAHAVAFSALASGATIALAPGSTPAAFALACASGWLFAEVWRRAGGALAAIAAHALWSLATTSLLRGGVAYAVWTSGTLTEGARASGAAAWLGAAACATLAAAATRWRHPSPAR
jgi:membrane protease YdiL (CAAX protease family)